MIFRHIAPDLRFAIAILVALGAVAGSSTYARAQGLLYGFETGLEGWAATGYPDSDFISIGQSTSGATQGSQSMVVESGPTYGWDVNASVSPGSPLYDLYNTVAADLENYTLDFDVTTTSDSFAGVSSPGDYFLINVAVNSDAWREVYNVSPNLTNQIGTFPVSIPMANLPVAQDASFYQLNIGSNSNHVNGAGGEGVKYFIDNIRFTRLPQLTETLLFSWETPDDIATPVNEQFEGWQANEPVRHVQSISTQGATDGSSAFQIDRTGLTAGFVWGSNVSISGGAGNPEGQAIIDQLISAINGARAISFDVTFDDSFPNTPTFTKFGLQITDHRADDSFSWFDAEGASINGVQPIGTTVTVTIPLASMTDDNRGTLSSAGLTPGSDFLRIGLSTNTDGGGIYQIDNFRVIREVPSLVADFNGDGAVDGADLAEWKGEFGVGPGADADGDGDSDGHDFLAWQREVGAGSPGQAAAVAAVPEPTTLVLLGGALLGLGRRRYC